MTAEQIAAHRARNQHANMTPDNIADHQARNQRWNMSPVNVTRARARDDHRRTNSFLPVEQQWDLENPCAKYVCVIFFVLFYY